MADTSLHGFLAEETRFDPQDDVQSVVDAILARHGQPVMAVLFYGSALREADDLSKMLDFYVLSEGNRAFHRHSLAALFNWLLPPNVYHLTIAGEDGGAAIRAKYAVLTLDAFERRTSRRGIESQGWGRFSQPCAIVYARDDETRDRLVGALAGAVSTMLRETVALMPAGFSAAEIWIRALRESYRAELRAERPGRADELYGHASARYDRIAELVLLAPDGEKIGVRQTGSASFEHDAPRAARTGAQWRWRARRVTGKTLSALRVLKSAFTFDGGLDYILGKIEDHSGVTLTPTPWQQRHPVLAAPVLAWRLYRQGAFR